MERPPGICMESNKGRGSLTSRYLAALLAPAVIAGVMQVTWPFFQHNPVLPYLLAVIFCAWYGGLGPGLLSVVISFLLTDFFFIEPYFFFWFPKQADLVRLHALRGSWPVHQCDERTDAQGKAGGTGAKREPAAV